MEYVSFGLSLLIAVVGVVVSFMKISNAVENGTKARKEIRRRLTEGEEFQSEQREKQTATATKLDAVEKEVEHLRDEVRDVRNKF